MYSGNASDIYGKPANEKYLSTASDKAADIEVSEMSPPDYIVTAQKHNSFVFNKTMFSDGFFYLGLRFASQFKKHLQNSVTRFNMQ